MVRTRVWTGKPAPDIFLEAARRLGCDPSRCVVFEDSPAGIQAGLAAGMLTVALPDPRMPSNAPKFAALAPRWTLPSIGAFDCASIQRIPPSRRQAAPAVVPATTWDSVAQLLAPCADDEDGKSVASSAKIATAAALCVSLVLVLAVRARHK